MAIGSPDKAARLAQLRVFARCQVRSGYQSDNDVRAEVLEAVRDEVSDEDEATKVADEMVTSARQELADEAASWPTPTGFERFQAALTELRAHDVVVLEAVDDHWAAAEELRRLDRVGARPVGIAYFTDTDVWHAIENHMLELNVWHGTTANVAPGDDLLDLVCATLEGHGLPAHFDEGRIEVTLEWQRPPTWPAA